MYIYLYIYVFHIKIYNIYIYIYIYIYVFDINIYIYIYHIYVYMYRLCIPLFKMSRKDIHKISIIFRLFTNLLRTNLNKKCKTVYVIRIVIK